jgi:hopanoid biosynthesis associated protein HpnK
VRQLIVTADDFGAALAVNEAVEQAHRDGILTCASLMVSGEAAADAVARAREMPRLGVGLHIVLVEGKPALPPEQVPDLIDETGHFRTNMVAAGIDMFFRPRVRRQLAAEIEAQFAAFAATGLPLDHVNAHKHFHLHPTIASLILKIGPRFGMKAARAPVEPRVVLSGIDKHAGASIDVAAPWARFVQHRFSRAGLTVPDQVFGLAWTGAMTGDRVRALIGRLPPGLSEIYCHPAAENAFTGSAPGYLYQGERDALIDPAVITAIADAGVKLRTFASESRESRTK